LPTRFFTLDLSVSLLTFVQQCESACHYHICAIAAMFYGVQKGVETPFSDVPTPKHPWKSPTVRPIVQVTMKAASQHFSTRASFKPTVFDLFYQNGSCTYRRPRANTNRVKVLGLLYILSVLSHYCNVK